MRRKIGWGVLSVLIAICLFLVFSIGTIKFTPLHQISEVNQTLRTINSVNIETTTGDDTLYVGWSSINITPQNPIDMAGYGPRGPYTSVYDSLYSKAVVIDNGQKEVVLINLDLIMFPRLVKEEVYKLLEPLGFSKDEIYLTATHTHNGFGNWEKSIAGSFIFGDYDDENVNYLVQQIIQGVIEAKNAKSPAKIGFQKIDTHELVMNRLAGKKGTKDPYLRVIHIEKDNGQKGLMVSFAGHAVNLDSDVWELSRDYPGILVDVLEEDPKIDFALFCAGMVASHNIDIDIPKGHERITEIGKRLGTKIISSEDTVMNSRNSTIGSLDLDVGLPPSQLRITKHIRIRDWLFSALLGPLKANIKVLEIGDVLLLGMPSDFSGELSVNNQLDKYAKNQGKELFITSFNGNYVGYITEDAHYNTCDHDEVKTLNWVGPYMGAYFTEIIKSIIDISAD